MQIECTRSYQIQCGQQELQADKGTLHLSSEGYSAKHRRNLGFRYDADLMDSLMGVRPDKQVNRELSNTQSQGTSVARGRILSDIKQRKKGSAKPLFARVVK